VLGIIVITIFSIYPIFQETQPIEKLEFNFLDFARDIIPPNANMSRYSFDYDYSKYEIKGEDFQHILLALESETPFGLSGKTVIRTDEMLIEMWLFYGLKESEFLNKQTYEKWEKTTSFRVKQWTFNYHEYTTGSDVKVHMCTLNLGDDVLVIRENTGLFDCKKIIEVYLNDNYSYNLSFSTDKTKKIENMFSNCNEMYFDLGIGTGYELEDWENIDKVFECPDDVIDININCFMEKFIPDCCKAIIGLETEPEPTGFRVIQQNNYTLCAHENSRASELYGFSDGYCHIQLSTDKTDAVDLSLKLGETLNLENIGFNETEVCERLLL
jgi:hypothetical protein